MTVHNLPATGMTKYSVQLESEKLRLGMYVDRLDRPWIETPFMFQGFEIRNDRELQQLRQLCEYVYVDTGRGCVPQDQILSAAVSRPGAKTVARRTQPKKPDRLRSLMAEIMRTFRAKPVTPEPVAELRGNTTTLREEVQPATQAYDKAVAGINQVLDGLRDGRGLDSRQLRDAMMPVVESLIRNQDAMAWLIFMRKRDEYGYQHSVATAAWAVTLGRHLGFDRATLDNLAMGGALLDVGKSKLPLELFQKAGRLSESEIQLMQRHVGLGLDIIRATPDINSDIQAMVECHHERFDGSGYPGRLAGQDIPMVGQIAGLVDCFDAMTTRRPYAEALSPYDSIRELLGLGDKLFQRELIEQFVQAMGMFPAATLVELSNGRVGVVVEQNRVRRLRPKIMILLDAEKQPIQGEQVVDLGALPSDEREAGAIWITRGLEIGAYGLDPRDYFT